MHMSCSGKLFHDVQRCYISDGTKRCVVSRTGVPLDKFPATALTSKVSSSRSDFISAPSSLCSTLLQSGFLPAPGQYQDITFPFDSNDCNAYSSSQTHPLTATAYCAGKPVLILSIIVPLRLSRSCLHHLHQHEARQQAYRERRIGTCSPRSSCSLPFPARRPPPLPQRGCEVNYARSSHKLRPILAAADLSRDMSHFVRRMTRTCGTSTISFRKYVHNTCQSFTTLPRVRP